MSISNWLGDSTSDPLGLNALNQAAQSNRLQMANFALAQASSYMSAGMNDKAITALKKATTFDSNNTTAYNYLGQLYLKSGDTDNAIKSYQQLIRIQSNTDSKDTSTNAPTLEAATIGLANSYLQAGKYVQSEEQFKAAAKLDPKDPVPIYTLGQQYFTQGRVDEALAMFQKTQKISPNDGNVYYALGQVYNAQRNYSDAVTALQQSIKLKPNFPSANYELGVAYNGLGNNDGVQEQLNILLNSSDPVLASDLNKILRPKMVGIDTSSPGNTFNASLLPGTSLLALNPAYITPNSDKTLSIVIQFDSSMDAASVQDINNWKISKANSPDAGYYVYLQNDTGIPDKPLSITYNDYTQEATVSFLLKQNSTISGVIDPSHLVFTFLGNNSNNQSMDPNSNSIDGASYTPFASVNTVA